MIAISSPHLVPTQAALVRLYDWPPEKQNNGVNSVFFQDKTNLSLLAARFRITLVGIHILACYVLNVLIIGKMVAHPVWFYICKEGADISISNCHTTERQAREFFAFFYFNIF